MIIIIIIIVVIYVIIPISLAIIGLIADYRITKELQAKKEALKIKIKEEEEIAKQLEEKHKKQEEHKEALAWCTKRCNEYKQEQNKKLIEVLNKI